MLHRQDLKQARGYAAEALDIARERGEQGSSSVASIRTILGTVDLECGDLPAAEAHFQEALIICRRLGERTGEAMALMNIGRHRLRALRHAEATQFFLEARSLNAETGELQAEAVNLGDLAVAYENVQEHERALECCKASLHAFDRLWNRLSTDHERVTFGDTFADVARRLQFLLLRRKRGVEALECAEHSRSRSLERLMAQQRLADPNAGGTGAGAGAGTGAGAGDGAGDGAGVGAGAGTGAAAMPCGIEEIVGLARRRRLGVVVYSVLEEDVLAMWVISRGGTKLGVYDTKPELGATLEQLVANTRGALEREGRRFVRREAASTGRDIAPLDDGGDADADAVPPDRSSVSVSADEWLRRCHQLLVAPFAAALADDREVLIVPSEHLYAIPFAALVDAQGVRLIERHAISVAPSIGALLEIEGRRGAVVREVRATVVGDPSFYDARLQLPGARREAEEVRDLLSVQTRGGSRVCVTHLSDEAASKAAVKAAVQESEYVHLATHGFSSGVLLAGPRKRDALMSMAEVQALELRRARLVVLSACDSFQGELSSDGLVGISRAFMAAGAQTLIASLWPIHDSATRVLMGRFYGRYFGDGCRGNAALALQGAMVSMLGESTFHPWQWAAFIAFGLGREEEAAQEVG